MSVALEGVRDDFRYRDHVTSEVASSFVVGECDDETQTDRRNHRACMALGVDTLEAMARLSVPRRRVRIIILSPILLGVESLDCFAR